MVTAIILAGGVGSRVGADRPKQFVEILGKPVLAYTAEIFQNHPAVDAIEIVCHKSWIDYLENMVQKYKLSKVKWVADGGATFQESCMNGVEFLKDKISENDYVLIQYGAAPFTSAKIITDVIRVMREKNHLLRQLPAINCSEVMIMAEKVIHGLIEINISKLHARMDFNMDIC